jgi:hypothetical protein
MTDGCLMPDDCPPIPGMEPHKCEFGDNVRLRWKDIYRSEEHAIGSLAATGELTVRKKV